MKCCPYRLHSANPLKIQNVFLFLFAVTFCVGRRACPYRSDDGAFVCLFELFPLQGGTEVIDTVGIGIHRDGRGAVVECEP